MNSLQFKAVIFDLDGLVLDTEPTYFYAWQQTAMSMGKPLSDAFCLSLSGLSYPQIEQKLLLELGADFDLTAFNQHSGSYWREHVLKAGIKTRPGFEEVLQTIKHQQLPYCLATNSPAANALECLALAGLEAVFPMLITRDDVRHGKPNPEIFLLAANRLQIEIAQCLVLEDSAPGIAAAKAAGAVPVYIPSTPKPDPQAIRECQLMVDDLLQACRLFKTYQ